MSALHHVFEFAGFGVEIVLVFGVAADQQRQALGDVDAAVAHGLQFFRIVGQQAHGSDAEMIVNVLGDGKVAGIDRQAERKVGFDGVHALILQGVGADFVDQADAAAFLAQIDDNAAAFGLHRAHGSLKLGAAVAFLRCQRVAGQAFGVDAREHGGAVAPVAHGQGDVFLAAAAVFKTVHGEHAVFGGQAAGSKVSDGVIHKAFLFAWVVCVYCPQRSFRQPENAFQAALGVLN